MSQFFRTPCCKVKVKLNRYNFRKVIVQLKYSYATCKSVDIQQNKLVIIFSHNFLDGPTTIVLSTTFASILNFIISQIVFKKSQKLSFIWNKGSIYLLHINFLTATRV